MSEEDLLARHYESLRYALGDEILGQLARPETLEVMANPDGTLWVDRIGEGRICLGLMDEQKVESVIRLMATAMRETVGPDRPSIGGVLPRSGERFQGLLPPLVERPTFSIRKRPGVVFTLQDYMDAGMLSPGGAGVIRRAVAERQNILVAGGTGSGKTTLVNAILSESDFRHDRVILLEDTRELQCVAEDRVELLTKTTPPAVTMTDLLRITLRLRPDRIIVGEVRGGEALAMIKAWNTGHPGGVATLHANSAQDALRRIEELIGEVSSSIPRVSIASAINLIVFIHKVKEKPFRRVDQIVAVKGVGPEGYYLEPLGSCPTT